MCINVCADFVLSKRPIPGTFETVCGTHHESMSDVKGIAVILFDERELGHQGLQHKIFKSKYKVCELLDKIWTDMEIKMQSPVVVIEPLPKGWVGHEVDGIRGSCAELPIEVDCTPEPPFTPQRQRGEGRPSTAMWEHLRQTGHCNRRKWNDPYDDLLFTLFLFFSRFFCLLRSRDGQH